jgi:hypothetical protein
MRPSPLRLAAVSTLFSALVAAQPAPDAPPPAAPYPPPYSGPYPGPPAYYPPPHGYAPRSYEPPLELPYRKGAPIPTGYHLEERPRTGLITAGWIVTAIPYGVGLVAGASASFHNASGWLAVPFVGPWLTLGRRDYSCDDLNEDDDSSEGLGCAGDVLIATGLILDGVMQATGGTLLLFGYTTSKTTLVRNDAVLRIRPVRVGTGHGIGFDGTF